MGWISLRQGWHKFLPGVTVQPRILVAETLGRLESNAKVCDVGAGGRKITPDTFTIDGFVGSNTDLVCDVHHIEMPGESFDCVFCTGTLEHVEDPGQVLSEIKRLLKPGGVVHVEVPFMQGYHADPEDYWRWTLNGLRLMCQKKGFQEIDSGVHIGPSSSVCWLLNEYSRCLSGEGVFGAVFTNLVRIVLGPVKFLDYFLNQREHAQVIASGVYFVGRK